MLKFFKKWSERRALAPLATQLAHINAREAVVSKFSDEELQAEAAELRERAAQGMYPGLIVRAFALVREVARRKLGMRAYDVQIMGALAMLDNNIAEMGTGEGKTLTAVFVVFVKSLEGKQVHVSTANEYLASRDAYGMSPVYGFLGLTVGINGPGTLGQKRTVYSCPVVYGTHITFAQDYLADNLAPSPAHVVQRELAFALIDEVDSALLDDARTPVVLTANRPADPEFYASMGRVAEALRRSPGNDGDGDFWVDGKVRQPVLTDAGYERAAHLLGEAGLFKGTSEHALYLPENQSLLQQLSHALSARHLLFKDQHYVVQDGAIVLVDGLTGRLLPGRKWSDGLQQALESKEGVAIQPEALTLGTITLQNYFKLYRGLAGMTGTAHQEAEEFKAVYGLGVVRIPPNTPSLREDAPDRVFRTLDAKFAAVVAEIEARHAKGQPVLVGTPSIEQSERLSALLAAAGLPHEVLNARQHAREAEIIAMAGVPGAITVATNMAGRGVDIVLGGNVKLALHRMRVELGEQAWADLSEDERASREEAVRYAQAKRAEAARFAGGLHIIGTERYDSRRLDDQLRGRAGRQGDPGSTCFYLSFEDSLIENFAGEQLRAMLSTLDIKPGEEIEQLLVYKAIDGAQRQVEAQGALVRKQMTQYDTVLDDQRRAFYAQRAAMRDDTDLHPFVNQVVEEEIVRLVGEFAPERAMYEEWDLEGLRKVLSEHGIVLADSCPDEHQALLKHVRQLATERFEQASGQVPVEQLPLIERQLILRAMDQHWFAHLAELEHLRKGIHLRGFAKKDPQQEFKREAFELFAHMLNAIKSELARHALTWQAPKSAAVAELEQAA